MSTCGMRFRSLVFFFFQAEDGIRDLVRSRGLGDVYKRQIQSRVVIGLEPIPSIAIQITPLQGQLPSPHPADPVSYTHLTLPTSDLV